MGIFLSVDLDLRESRISASEVRDGKLFTKIIHEFRTVEVHLGDAHYWDILGIFDNVLTGLKKASEVYGDDIVSLGVNGWSHDYGLFDKKGQLLSNPRHHSDPRVRGIMNELAKLTNDRTVYAETGIQIHPQNTLIQLYADKLSKSSAYKMAEDLLFIPDIINYWLTGVMATERSIAAVSQCLNPRTRKWSHILDQVELPTKMFKTITEPGTSLGELLPEIQNTCNLSKCKVIAVASHNTAAALTSILPESETTAYAVLGDTTSVGIGLHEPLITAESMNNQFSNELGAGDVTYYHSNFPGLDSLYQILKAYGKEDKCLFSILDSLKDSERFPSRINPDKINGLSGVECLSKIQECCRESGQEVPDSLEQTLSVLIHSIISKAQQTFIKLGPRLKSEAKEIYAISDGIQSEYFCQNLANAAGVNIITGSSSARINGNATLQMIALGEIKTPEDALRLNRNSYDSKTYSPVEDDFWSA